MITKSVANFMRTKAQMDASIIKNLPKRSMGGGKKKPPMPAAETNFDLLVVGNINCNLIINRWFERYIFDKVPLKRWS